MTEWKREYKRAFPTCALVFVGFVLGIMGLVFLLLFPAIGVPLLLGAIGIPFLIRYLFANYVITCGPEGFSVTTESKRAGREHNEYRWDEVTATNYEEYEGTRDNPRRLKYFSVDTARGQAFRVDDKITQFADLINTFNYSTLHLPYIWQPQTGVNIRIGAVSAGRNAYHKVLRPEATETSAGQVEGPAS